MKDSFIHWSPPLPSLGRYIVFHFTIMVPGMGEPSFLWRVLHTWLGLYVEVQMPRTSDSLTRGPGNGPQKSSLALWVYCRPLAAGIMHITQSLFVSTLPKGSWQGFGSLNINFNLDSVSRSIPNAHIVPFLFSSVQNKSSKWSEDRRPSGLEKTWRNHCSEKNLQFTPQG